VIKPGHHQRENAGEGTGSFRSGTGYSKIETLYGIEQTWWRSDFQILERLKAAQEGLLLKKRTCRAARQMTIYNYGRDRKAYYDKLAEIENDETREKELNEQLNSLDIEASKAGVPAEWRQ
jgi:hypothetical protein